MNIVPTSNIEQSIAHLQQLPIQEQQTIFSHIDALMLKYQANNEKRQFGLYQHQGYFKLNDDFEMTEKELLND